MNCPAYTHTQPHRRPLVHPHSRGSVSFRCDQEKTFQTLPRPLIHPRARSASNLTRLWSFLALFPRAAGGRAPQPDPLVWHLFPRRWCAPTTEIRRMVSCGRSGSTRRVRRCHDDRSFQIWSKSRTSWRGRWDAARSRGRFRARGQPARPAPATSE